MRVFGLGRTFLYVLIGAEKIRSTSLRERCEQAHASVAKFPGLAEVIERTVAFPSGVPLGAVFDVLVVDEAHHAMARTWAAIIRRHAGALGGFSATPLGDDQERNRKLFV